MWVVRAAGCCGLATWLAQARISDEKFGRAFSPSGLFLAADVEDFGMVIAAAGGLMVNDDRQTEN